MKTNDQVNEELARLLAKIRASPPPHPAILKSLVAQVTSLLAEIRANLPRRLGVSFDYQSRDGAIAGTMNRMGTVRRITLEPRNGTTELEIEMEGHNRPPLKGPVERYRGIIVY